jgi:hypothetical protein
LLITPKLLKIERIEPFALRLRSEPIVRVLQRGPFIKRITIFEMLIFGSIDVFIRSVIHRNEIGLIEKSEALGIVKDERRST